MADVTYLECRRSVFGHPWEKFYPIKRPWTDCAHILSARCPRCLSERHWGFDRFGQRVHAKYIYPDDYSVPKDEMPDKEDMILRIIRADRERVPR